MTHSVKWNSDEKAASLGTHRFQRASRQHENLFPEDPKAQRKAAETIYPLLKRTLEAMRTQKKSMKKTRPVSPASLNVLFIGNSFTARNDVPGLIAQMAAARGKQLRHQLIQAGGASLRMHWNKAEAQQVIQQNQFDYVVLQEQSTLPIKNAQRTHENIRLFDPVIKAAGAKTALYLTWARQNAPETQQAINDAYNSIGKELGATIIPAGIAWEAFMQQHEQPVLHDKDLSHPSLAGSYLAACVFYATLFRDNPVGIACDLKGLTQAEAELLQQTAWETVQQQEANHV